MNSITGLLMLEDTPIATVKDGIITESNEVLLPLYLKRTKNMEGWLASRAIDGNRTNSRLLKKALHLRNSDDAATSLAVNAATITDRFWFKPSESTATYEDVRFKGNPFAELALRGDPDCFSLTPSRTPDLTCTGSFEKCWKLIDGKWWLYKSENSFEYFSELFICKLGEKLALNMAHYELDGKYIRSEDFTHGAKYNFEPMLSLTDDECYENCFNILYDISPVLAKDYLILVWFDSICYNMDRHTGNFGVLRDIKTGEIISLAPNYDNNIALIAKGYPQNLSRTKDGIIRFFSEFVDNCPMAREMYGSIDLPVITEDMIYECMNEIPIEVDREYIRAFILNGQQEINELFDKTERLEDNKDDFDELTL